LQLVLITEAAYIWTMIFLKLSLGAFFYRIMVKKWQQISIHVILFLNTAVGIAYFFFAIFECGVPLRAELYWSRYFHGQCFGPAEIKGASYTHAVVAVVTDLSLLGLAIHLLVITQMKAVEKRIVIGIFAIAIA
jgi:hypothetical protein